MAQEHVHRAHHIGVGVEGASGKANIAGLLRAKTLHPARFAADHTHRQTATQRFAIGDHVGCDTKVLLRAAPGQAKAQKHLVQDQGDAFGIADCTQLHQPVAVGGAVVMHFAGAIHQRRVSWCGAIGMHGLQGIDQHAGDVVAVAQHLQGVGVHFVEGERVRGRRHGVAWAGLHVIPPAVVGASKAHDFVAPGVVARQAHRLHHRLGARHMERHLVLPGDAAQPLHVVEHTRVVATQNRPQGLGHGRALGHAVFVVIQAQQIHAVRAGDVDKPVAVHVRQVHALAALPVAAGFDVALKHLPKLKGNADLPDQLHVRDQALGGLGVCQRQRAAALQLRAQRDKCLAPLSRNRGRGTVGAKPGGFVIAIGGHHLGNPLGHAQMAAQRRVLSKGQLQPLLGLATDPQGCACAGQPLHPFTHAVHVSHAMSFS